MLPACEYRGAETQTRKGKAGYECTHPKMRRGEPFIIVRPDNCLECTVCTFDSTQLKEQYEQAKPRHVTKEQFQERVEKCDSCEQRAGNYCCATGGCGLIVKLRAKAFGCPIGKFS